jgi:hypothetical protein
MRQARDYYQRKVYAVVRMSLATIRVGKSNTKAEKEKAASWEAAWAAISGLRQFKLIPKVRK